MLSANVKISNGTIILPKAFIEQLHLKGDRDAQARIEGGYVVIGIGKEKTQAPYRIFNDAEINQFLKDDRLPKLLVKKIQARLSGSK